VVPRLDDRLEDTLREALAQADTDTFLAGVVAFGASPPARPKDNQCAGFRNREEVVGLEGAAGRQEQS
jgi:hypothetical protein